jgi:tetratricopeptide (TPR) repeat protein
MPTDAAQALLKQALAMPATTEAATAVLDTLHAAAAADPTFPDPWLHIGVMHQNFLNNSAALAAFDQVLALQAHNIEALGRRAACLAELGRYGEAMTAIDHAIEQAQAQHDTRFIQALTQGVRPGIALLQAKAQAEADYRALAADGPSVNTADGITLEEVSTRLNGLLPKTVDDLPIALGGLTQLIAEQPRLSPAYLDRANLYLALHQNDKAMYDLTMALLLSPEIEAAYYRRYELFSVVGRFTEMIADMTALAARTLPYKGEVYMRRAEAYRLQGDAAAAHADQEAFLAEPIPAEADPRLYYERARLRFERSQFAEALPDLNHFLTLPLQPQILAEGELLRGRVHMGLGDAAAALEDFQSVAPHRQHDHTSTQMIVAMAKQLNRPLDAAEAWEAYIKHGARGGIPVHVAQRFADELRRKAGE